MSIQPDDNKGPEISADEKNLNIVSGAVSTDDSDKEFQQTRQIDGKSTFNSGAGHHLYRPIDSYEGIHRWDPDFEWTENEEKRIVRKVR
jgi:hypothetical protein